MLQISLVLMQGTVSPLCSRKLNFLNRSDTMILIVMMAFLGKQKPKQSLLEDSLGCFVIYKRQNDALLKYEQEGPMARVFAFEYSVYHPGW